MTTLVIDTATDACSVALIDGARIIDARHDVVGRGHAERLLPMIAELPDGGRADAILVDCGPGSFTGVRVGLAAAIGLGIGWGVPVRGYSSTTLVAAAAFHAAPRHERIAVVLEGGHGEVFVEVFDPNLAVTRPLASMTPLAAAELLRAVPAFGNGVRHVAEIEHGSVATFALPDARDVILLPRDVASLPARPIYGRAPDAKLPTPR